MLFQEENRVHFAVREQLKAIGYDTSKEKHANVMASIHSVLKRMKDADEIKSKEAKDGSGTRYYYAAESKLPTGSVMVNTARIWADANAASNMSKDMQAFVKAAEALTTSDAIKQLGRTLQSVQEMGNFVGQVEQTHMLKPEGEKK